MGKISPKSRVFVLKLVERGFGVKKIFSRFKQPNWKFEGIKSLVRKIKRDGGIERKRGSGRPRTARIEKNIQNVVQLAVSPPLKPHSHLSTRKISQKTKIHRSSVVRILRDSDLVCYKRVPVQKLSDKVREKRLNRSKALLQKLRNFNVANIIFSDEKDFLIDTAPVNSQNNRVYSSAKRKCDVPVENLTFERSRFSKKLMVWAGVCKNGKTDIQFVEPGTKVNKVRNYKF